MNKTTDMTSLSQNELINLDFIESGVLKVLFLEDLNSDAELVSYHIGEIPFKHEIHHVKNKLEFMEALESKSFNLVISDYNLPQYTGKEALIHIKSISPYIPFIICTGRINEETAVECIKLGADDYVLKDDLDVLTEELRSREENLRAITENSPSVIYSLNKEGKVLYSSRPEDESILKSGDSIFNFASSNFQEIFRENLNKCWLNASNVTFELCASEDEKTNWYSCNMGPVIFNNEVTQLVFIPHDISKLKTAERNLKNLNKRMNLLNNHIETVRDEEKKKIAMEIHDQLGQELIGNKLGLFWLKRNISESDPEIHSKIDDLVDLSSQIIQTVRRIAHELRPVVLDDVGLIAALEWHVSNFNNSSEILCSLKTEVDNEDFNKDLATTIYRIVQESLTNINKHSEAQKAEIKLQVLNGTISLEISDDGIGIEVDKALNSSSMGIFGMQERIKPFNGKFQLKNNNPGTLITIQMNQQI